MHRDLKRTYQKRVRWRKIRKVTRTDLTWKMILIVGKMPRLQNGNWEPDAIRVKTSPIQRAAQLDMAMHMIQTVSIPAIIWKSTDTQWHVCHNISKLRTVSKSLEKDLDKEIMHSDTP